MSTIKSQADVEKLIQDENIEFVSVRFTDLLGQQRAFTIPTEQLIDEAFGRGLFFDGSSVAGFQKINNSDMKLVPEPDTSFIDPFRTHKTLDMYFDVVTPVTSEPYSRDPREVAIKAEAYLKYTGIADTANFGLEPEFFMFDTVSYDTTMKGSYFHIDADEAHWNSGSHADSINTPGLPNKGFKMREGEGYFQLPPLDHEEEVRAQMLHNLTAVGLSVEKGHHEVAEGQHEIDYRFNDMLHACDDLETFKYVVRETAHSMGKVVTFMPKPMAGENGTGMHCHQSLWKDGKPLFYSDEGYAGLSDIARWYIGGLIQHAPAVLAFTNPTTNSYRRLVPGFEAPIDLVYSARNRSAAIRVPLAGNKPSNKRFEFRVPDTTCNPYLGLSAQLMAGLDGILNRIEPPKPIDKNLYELPPEEATGIKTVPSSLSGALDALEADHDFLMQGDVFTQDLLDAWVSIKRDEITQQSIVPTPMEYDMYFNA